MLIKQIMRIMVQTKSDQCLNLNFPNWLDFHNNDLIMLIKQIMRIRVQTESDHDSIEEVHNQCKGNPATYGI